MSRGTTQALIALATAQAIHREREKLDRFLRERAVETPPLEQIANLIQAAIDAAPERFKSRDPTAAEIADAVAAWLAPRLHSLQGQDADPPSELELATLIQTIIYADPERFRGLPGRGPTAAEMAEAVSAWLAPRLESLRGRDADPPSSEQLTPLIEAVIATQPDRFRGEQGRGIRSLRINVDGDLIVTYTDDAEENAGRISKTLQTVFLGGGSSGGEAAYDVFIEDAPAVLTYAPVSGYPGLYLESVASR